jgi:hypothetical protein
VQSSIQPDSHFMHLVICLFTATKATAAKATAGGMAADHNHLVVAIMKAQNSPSFSLLKDE